MAIFVGKNKFNLVWNPVPVRAGGLVMSLKHSRPFSIYRG